MGLFRRFLALSVCCTLLAYAQGNTFTKVRYNGGSVSTTVKPDDWDNKLTVTADAITLALKDGKTLTIPPKQVTSLSYGQEAHRRVGTAIGLAMISLGVGVLFLLHKTKLHFIGINYTDTAGKKEGVLLQGDKSNFRAIIVALQGVTGVPVSVSEKERSEIPAGIAVQSVREQEEPKQASEPAPANTVAPLPPASAPAATTAPPAQEASASISITSNPDAADIYVDDAFSGNAPATLKLSPGKHTIRVSCTGYKPWSREITVQAGSEAHLAATLEKLN
jgi:PEGA domain